MSDVIVTAIDDFGEAVGEALRMSGAVRSVRFAATAELALASGAAVVVVAALDDQRVLRRRADDLAFATGAWIVPVHIDDVGLTLGPVVVPGRTACYHCYEDWRARQGGEVDLEAALASSERTSSTQSGFLPPHLTLATHFVLRHLRSDANEVAERAVFFRYLWRVPDLKRIEFAAQPGCVRCDVGGRVVGQLRRQPVVARR